RSTAWSPRRRRAEAGEWLMTQIPEERLVAVGREPKLRRRIHPARALARDASLAQESEHRARAVLRSGEDEAVAREGREPRLDLDARRARDAVEFQSGSDAGRFEHHEERPRHAGVAHVLAGVDRARSGQRAEHGEVAAEGP